MASFPYPRPAPGPGLLATFLSFRGRIGRISFSLCTLLMLAAVCGVFAAAVLVQHGGPSDQVGMALIGLAILILIVVGCSLEARRLQDIGRPGLLALLPMLARAGWMAALSRINLFHNDGWLEISLALLLADVAALVLLVFWPGQGNANRYGPLSD